MSDAADNTAEGIELANVRTTADAAVWLKASAAMLADAATKAASPVDAEGFVMASETTHVLAQVLPTLDTATAGRMLTTMARDYQTPDVDDPGYPETAHWWACTHLADTFGPAGAQLTAAATPPRGQHIQQADRDLGRQL